MDRQLFLVWAVAIELARQVDVAAGEVVGSRGYLEDQANLVVLIVHSDIKLVLCIYCHLLNRFFQLPQLAMLEHVWPTGLTLGVEMLRLLRCRVDWIFIV